MRDLNAQLANRNRELLHAKREAELSAHELEAFSYSVSHDLRAPLRALDGLSHMLVEGAGERLDAKSLEHVARMRALVARMSELIEDLLRLARVSLDELTRSPVDLSALARGVCLDLEQREPDRRVAWSVQDGLCAHADERLLRVLIENLLGNAWKFTSKVAAPRIEVGTNAGAGPSVFFVQDNGAGFDMAHAARLFKPFQRLHSQADFPGSGIGLATVARIVSRHGGELNAHGEVAGGARISFSLGA